LGELDFEAEASRMRTFQAFLDANKLADRVTCPLPVIDARIRYLVQQDNGRIKGTRKITSTTDLQ
jgi:hypothetical protein